MESPFCLTTFALLYVCMLRGIVSLTCLHALYDGIVSIEGKGEDNYYLTEILSYTIPGCTSLI